ncbi:MAG TPA: LPS export ABC transporter periplasmic protein LptC [Rhizomicrobium sp.]|nr:LPS export ABC transporter periplasmic protein LptC [Rhizomicrobium sp.]
MARRNPTPAAVAQPLAPRRSVSGGMDWAARTRGSMASSKRYTRFVTVMKRVLLIAALALLAAVLAYAMQPRRQERMALSFQKLGLVNNDLAMVKPRLTGLDTEGNPYVVTAETAIQEAKNTRRARLIGVDADLTEKKQGTWLNVTAPSGLLDADAHRLMLQGPVAGYSDNGYEVHTMAADVDLKNGIVRGRRMIVGQGPMGTMRADKFALYRDKRLVFLYGNVHMTVLPSQKPKKSKKP